MPPRSTIGAAAPGALILAYFLIYVVWGSTYFFIGIALDGFPPFLLGAMRFSIAGLLLLLYSASQGESVFKAALIRKSAVSGVILLFIDMAVVMLAQQYLSSSLVAIIASSTAVWIMALDIPMWKSNFKNTVVAVGIITGFGGVALLFIEQLGPDASSDGARGVLLLVFGCISWALGTLYAKYRSSSEESRNCFAGSAWQMIFAGSMFWLCALSLEDLRAMDVSAITLAIMAVARLPDPVWIDPRVFGLYLAPQNKARNRSCHARLRQPCRSCPAGIPDRRGTHHQPPNRRASRYPHQHCRHRHNREKQLAQSEMATLPEPYFKYFRKNSFNLPNGIKFTLS